MGDAKIAQQMAGAGVFLLRVGVAPAPGHGGQAGDHGVQRVLELGELPAQVGRGETDAGAQFEYVVFAELVAEDEYAAPLREGAGGQHADRGGFADAVRTEQHPTLPALMVRFTSVIMTRRLRRNSTLSSWRTVFVMSEILAMIRGLRTLLSPLRGRLPLKEGSQETRYMTPLSHLR